MTDTTPPLPHDEIAQLLIDADAGVSDCMDRARELAEKLPPKVAANLMAEVDLRLRAAPARHVDEKTRHADEAEKMPATAPNSTSGDDIPPMPKLGLLWGFDQNLVERIAERERLIEERKQKGMWKRILGNWRPDSETPVN